MSNIPSHESLFNEISESLEGHFFGVDQWGAKMWQYDLSDEELGRANKVLAEHSMDPVDRIYIGKQSEQDEDSSYGECMEVTNINLQAGRFIQYYSFTKYEDDEEIEAKKDIIIDADSGNLENLVHALSQKDNLRDYREEISEIGIQELFALSALVKVIKTV